MKKENNITIIDFSPSNRKEIIDLITKILEEFGFKLNQKLDRDLYNIENEYLKFFIVRNPQNIVGCIGIKKLSDKTAKFKRLYVALEYRGRGLGKKLIQKSIDFCLRNNFRKIISDTTKRNKAAIKLFQNFGFQKIKKEGENLFFEKNL